jgi:very-short-patch-repair endonuclease
MDLSAFLDAPLPNLHHWAFPLFVLSLVLFSLLVWKMRELACLIWMLPRKGAVRQKAVMTDNETEFFGRLQRALPDFDVWPQIGMGAILQPAMTEKNPKFWETMRQFQGKLCDFVIKKKGAPAGSGVVAVIELDDRTHDPKKDAVRDALLASAGITTLRYESRAKPSESVIRQQILALI